MDFQPKSDTIHRISVKIPFFQFLFIHLWEKLKISKKYKTISKNMKIWKQIRKSGLSTKIWCNALDFHWKSIFKFFSLSKDIWKWIFMYHILVYIGRIRCCNVLCLYWKCKSISLMKIFKETPRLTTEIWCTTSNSRCVE